MKKILLLNGPNLNLLGLRNPKVYGKTTLQEIVKKLETLAVGSGFEIIAKQSNYEGELIDWVQEAALKKSAAGIILNAGGLTHTSVSLRDAVDAARDLGVPTIEVHLSNIHKRETFRHVSLLTEVCIDQVSGKGPDGYLIGFADLKEYINPKKKPRKK